ncbi:hypothetical protein AB0G85_32465 [Streptomyces sioyaensis]|uniref:hypothetical protein n=1 Tax=Streptomyces sioyaensis TaxID=67364 RepID=UPI0033ED5FA4
MDPEADPRQRLAHDLRELRKAAGSPSYRTMTKAAGFSATALSQAAAGERLPSLAVVRGYVRAREADPAEWEPRWKEAEATAARAAGRSRILVTSLSAVLAVALIAALVAWQQHGDNERRRTDDAARRTAAVADALRTTDPQAAMLLGVAAWRISELPETRRALLGSLIQPKADAFTDPAASTAVPGGPGTWPRTAAPARGGCPAATWSRSHRTPGCSHCPRRRGCGCGTRRPDGGPARPARCRRPPWSDSPPAAATT